MPFGAAVTVDLSTSLEFAARTDTGRVRPHNEDAVLANPRLGLALLADGMGGYNAGEVTSAMAITLLGDELAKALDGNRTEARPLDGAFWARTMLEREIATANSAIYEEAQNQPQYAGMGTTLVAALFHDDRLTIAHVGDSRLYRLRDGDFQQLTRDHSLLQEQLDSGMISAEEARHSSHRNLLTRALGVDPAVEAEIQEHDVKRGDIYLMCSDGLYDMVEELDMVRILASEPANLESCADQLIAMANDNGGHDNVSVILVRARRAFPARRSWWGRLRAWFA